MKKRDRGQTPTNTSLVAGWHEAVSREIIEVQPDTASEAEMVNRSKSAKSILDGKQQGIEGDFIKIRKEKEDNVKLDKTIQRCMEILKFASPP